MDRFASVSTRNVAVVRVRHEIRQRAAKSQLGIAKTVPVGLSSFGVIDYPIVT
jgi:hypothetical protein